MDFRHTTRISDAKMDVEAYEALYNKCERFQSYIDKLYDSGKLKDRGADKLMSISISIDEFLSYLNTTDFERD